MKKHSKYALMGLRAIERAAIKVAEDARRNNYKIPVWIDGRIEYVIPEIPTRTTDSLDHKTTTDS